MKRSNYLKSLGITEWIKKTTEPTSQTLSFHCYSLFNNQNILKGLLIADIGTSYQKEGELLTAVCQAISKKHQNTPLPSNLPPSIQLTIFMGENSQKMFSLKYDIHSLSLYSPAKLLLNPILKREVWNKLKSNINLLK